MAFRRTGVGKLGLNRQQFNEDQYRLKGELIEAAQLKNIQEQFDLFQTNLQQFAIKHRKDIKEDPSFRQYFQRMCSEIGVDPLAWFWGELLGFGEFYYELAVQITEYCIKTRQYNGGIIELDHLLKHLVNKRNFKDRSKATISEDDVTRAIKTLKPLGGHYTILKLGNKIMLSTVPKELDPDFQKALVAGQKLGYLTIQLLTDELNWGEERSERVLLHLLEQGLCWLDEYEGKKQYFILSYFDSNL